MTKYNKKNVDIEALYVELVFDFLFSLHDDPTSIAHFRTSIWNFGSATTSSVLLKKVFAIRVFQSLENNGYPILNSQFLYKVHCFYWHTWLIVTFCIIIVSWAKTYLDRLVKQK